MEELRHGRRSKRARARSFLGAAAISASLTTPAARAFLTHQHRQCNAATRPAQSTRAPEKSWGVARGSSQPRAARRLLAQTQEVERRSKPLKWPPLVRSIIPGRGGGGGGGEPGAEGSELGGGGGDSAGVLPLTRSKPRIYEVELFRSVMECKRNSLVYLPTLVGKTLVAGMVLKRLLELNPGRQALFLVGTSSLAAQQVRVPPPPFPSFRPERLTPPTN